MADAIVVSGFFGRSNVGDEAMLQVIYEQLSVHFRVIIAVDHHGAHDNFWELYPYRECEIIGQSDRLSCARKDVVGFHAGGGGLGVGLPYTQLFYALAYGRSCVLSGIDWHEDYSLLADRQRRLCTELVRACSFFSVRTANSANNAAQRGLQLHHGADWAYMLEAEANGRASASPDQALVVIRHHDPRAVDLWSMREQCLALLDCLERLGYGVALLPFAPQDQQFAETLELARPIESHWSHPKRIKHLLAGAPLCVSVGRLHPLILAHSAGTPAIYVAASGAPDIFIDAKIVDFCRELAIPSLRIAEDNQLSPDEMSLAIAAAQTTSVPAPIVNARWADMRDRVITALRDGPQVSAGRAA